MNKVDTLPHSIVAEALASVGTLRKDSLDELMQKLRQQVTDIRVEVCQTVEQKYGQYLLTAIENVRNLNSKIATVADEIGRTKRKIDAQMKSNAELTGEKLKQIESELKITNENISALSSVADLSDWFQEIDNSNDIVKRAELIVKSESKLTAILSSSREKSSKHGNRSSDGSQFIIDKIALAALRNEFVTQKERLTYELSENWKDKIRCDVDETESRIQIRLLDSSDRDQFSSTLNSMSILSILDKKIVQLSKFLQCSLFEPIIAGEAYLNTESSDGTMQIFSAQKTYRLSKNAEEIALDVWKLFESLIKLFDFKILRRPDETKSANFIELIGSRAAEPILKDIVVKILKPAVPSDKSESKNFENLLNSCEVLEKNLKKCKFLRADFKEFEVFAADIDGLFLTKRCQTILTEARLLITSNLHNTVEVGTEDDPDLLAASVRDLMNIDDENLKDLQARMSIRFDNEKKLPAIFRFPKCRVSQTLFDFVHLLIRTLDEACRSSPDASGRLFETARYMLELFVAITPTYHKQALISMPLLPAIFYNNCYFLAHHLTTLGFEYAPKLLKAMALPSGAMQITFVDYVPKLHETASKCMQLVLTNQKQILTDFLKAAEGFVNLNDQERFKNCSKVLKQCLMQLQLLNRVWKDILTPTVLFKSQGILVGHFISSLNETILSMEDITSDDAYQNQKLFNEISKELENLFMYSKATEIHRFCQAEYLKFKEICFLLSASLQEIDDRWSSGQGPLAIWMKSDEVKRMIRALFQNTDKRASVLAKIK